MISPHQIQLVQVGGRPLQAGPVSGVAAAAAAAAVSAPVFVVSVVLLVGGRSHRDAGVALGLHV